MDKAAAAPATKYPRMVFEIMVFLLWV